MDFKVKTLLVVFAVLTLVSCQKDDDENQIQNQDPPPIPENIAVDMDNDGTDDYLIKYLHGIIFSPTSSEAIFCEFEILGENEILGKEDEPYLFLDNLNVISENVESPLEWRTIDGHVAALYKPYEEGWPSSWEISSSDIKNSYFIGLKFKTPDSEIKIGWIELEINSDTGAVNIIEKVVL
ncbi:MAG: hypothetical protein MI974_19085 [Chitinophagales bacterium]|nr:hypothetical protein [Chitinophagales bacterium]